MDKIWIYVWKQRKLNEVCKINGRIGFRGYTQKDIVSQEQGGVLTFSPTNIVDNTLTMKCRNTYITKEKYEESPEIKIKNGDILFVKTGSTLGKSALVMGLHENATINPQIVVLRTQEEEAKFLSVILISDSLLKKVAAVKIGGAVPTITEAELKNFTFYEPEDFAERVKIGNCFTYFDPIITFHHRKLNILNKICRYAWEQRKLGDVAQEFKSGNSLKADKIDITGDYPVYGGNGLRGYTSTYNHDGEYALIGRQGALCGNMNYSVGKAYFTEHAVVVKADANNDTRFLYYMLDTMNLGQYSDQSAQPGLAVNKLVKLENRFPIKEEQQRIGWYFSNLDHLITLHQQKCKQLQIIRKYMLKNMFL